MATLNSDFLMKKFTSELKKYATKKQARISTPRFVFLCGKGKVKSDEYSKTNRGLIQRYISNKIPMVSFAISEHVWNDLYKTDTDLLTFEVFLAEVSDYIILFVESMGSACELGAFTFDNKSFMKKLIIVLDEKYQYDESFIKTGPVMKAQKGGASIVYANLTGGLFASNALRNKVDEIVGEMSRKKQVNINLCKDKIMVYAFILEILEIIKLFQPVQSEKIIHLYKDIKGFDTFKLIRNNGEKFDIKIQYIINFLVAVDFIEEKEKVISLKKSMRLEDFMLSYSTTGFNKIRSQILAKKYKYKDL